MRKAAQLGFTHLLLILILAVGLVVGIYLVQQKTNLFSKAYNPVSSPVAVVDDRPQIIKITKVSPTEISILGDHFSKDVTIPLDYKFTIYVSTGGAVEYTSTLVKFPSRELIVDVAAIAGAIARDAHYAGLVDSSLLSNQYLRVCRTSPDYSCSAYVTIPNL